MKKRHKHSKSCQQYMLERAQANRDRKVEELFHQLEADAIRAFLTKDAPTREREKAA